MKQKSISTKIRQLLTYQKKPAHHRGNYAYIYELSNHLDTAYNAYAPVRAFRTGAFLYVQKIFEEISLKKSSAFLKTPYCPAKRGGSTTNFPTRKEVRMWNLIAGSFTISL